MRIAALYDIHGNLPALEAVLADVRAAEVARVVVGGDVLPGPMPRETLRLLFELDRPVAFIQGNGEREVLGLLGGGDAETIPLPFRAMMRWVGAQLSGDDRSRLAGWPPTLRLDVPGIGAVLFCHATPRSDAEIFTRRTPEARLRPIFEPTGAALVVCGHTHMPFDRQVGRVRVVNAGSVGMPFGRPGAAWLLLGPGIELRHTAYDLEAAAARIRATAYPQAEEFATGYLLDPPSEAAMLDVFERSALQG